MKKYITAVAVFFATPAYADMSHAEFAARNLSGDWVSPINNYSAGETSSVNVRPNKKAVADMVSSSASRTLGSKWSDTAVRLAKLESGFNCGAVGPQTRHGRARGVMQVMPRSASALGYNPSRLNECQHGIDAGIAHMAACIRSGVETHDQMARCHVAGVGGWNKRLNSSAERYKQKYVRLARR
jgi:hypothetical protein